MRSTYGHRSHSPMEPAKAGMLPRCRQGICPHNCTYSYFYGDSIRQQNLHQKRKYRGGACFPLCTIFRQLTFACLMLYDKV